MTYLQNALNEGAMDIMLRDAVASIEYEIYYDKFSTFTTNRAEALTARLSVI